ncbi:MAG: carboxypeptidase-like regulatory domain-containing protein [Dysgonamonadaceae bacterium]
MNILEYIKSPKKGKDAHEFEEELMNDPFLAEALEGYEEVDGNHILIVSQLRKRIKKKSKRKIFSHPRFIWSAIIASVLIVIFIAYYFIGGYHLEKKKEQQLPEQKENVQIKSAYNHEQVSELVKEETSDSKKESHSRQDVFLPKEKSVAGAAVEHRRNASVPHSNINNPIKNASPAQAQALLRFEALDVIGIVKDATGNPLMGVKVKSYSGEETMTDKQGRFALKSTTDKLVFSYIGFKSTEIALNKSKNPITVTMKEDDCMLAEQEIIGKDSWRSKAKSVVKAQPVIGDKAYAEYIDANKKLSKDSDCAAKKGKVKVAFSTDEKGRPYNIHITQGLCSESDHLAVYLINHGCNWTANVEDVEFEILF